jgi:hypothetical protein
MINLKFLTLSALLNEFSQITEYGFPECVAVELR